VIFTDYLGVGFETSKEFPLPHHFNALPAKLIMGRKIL
jgi:hypothetical protein